MYFVYALHLSAVLIYEICCKYIGDVLGGVMVIVLVTGLKVFGFKPGREWLIFKGDKIS
jgi:hypothetical protein